MNDMELKDEAISYAIKLCEPYKNYAPDELLTVIQAAMSTVFEAVATATRSVDLAEQAEDEFLERVRLLDLDDKETAH